MAFLRNIVTGLRSLFRKEQVNRELDEELGEYLEMAADEKMKQGMSRQDALRAVRLEGGSLDGTKEIVRFGGWESVVDTFWRDLPDRRVQEAVLLVFSKFLELGTARQTLLWFLEHDLQFPVYTRQGETCWKRPSYATIYRILTNPVYGGAYAYGKTEHTMRYENGGHTVVFDANRGSSGWPYFRIPMRAM